MLDGRDLAERSVPRELDPREDEGKLLAGRWVNSHELRAGDTVYLQAGEVAKLTRIEQRYEPYLPVSNLTVRKFHTFFVGSESVLVHNTSWCELRKEVLEEYKGVANVTELMIRRRMAEKLDNFDWTKHIQNSHGTDALGRTLAEAKAIDMPDIHGHHIEYKKVRKDVDVDAQNILLDNDIDPLLGKEVLVYAPNNRDGKGHSIAFNRETQDAIRKVAVDASRDKLSKEQTRQLIVTELQHQAERWIEKQWPGYLKSHSIFN